MLRLQFDLLIDEDKEIMMNQITVDEVVCALKNKFEIEVYVPYSNSGTALMRIKKRK